MIGVANLALEAEKAVRHFPDTDRVSSGWQEAKRIE